MKTSKFCMEIPEHLPIGKYNLSKDVDVRKDKNGKFYVFDGAMLTKQRIDEAPNYKYTTNCEWTSAGFEPHRCPLQKDVTLRDISIGVALGLLIALLVCLAHKRRNSGA